MYLLQKFLNILNHVFLIISKKMSFYSWTSARLEENIPDFHISKVAANPTGVTN